MTFALLTLLLILAIVYVAISALAFVIITSESTGIRPPPAWRSALLAAVWPLTLVGVGCIVTWCWAGSVIVYIWNHTVRRR